MELRQFTAWCLQHNHRLFDVRRVDIASVWLLTSPETYLQMTDGLAWSPDQYEQWLRQSMRDQLLGHDAL